MTIIFSVPQPRFQSVSELQPFPTTKAQGQACAFVLVLFVRYLRLAYVQAQIANQPMNQGAPGSTDQFPLMRILLRRAQ